VIMCTVTFGFYEMYWFYKNWKLIKQRTASDIMPFWRAFFYVLFCYPCFREMGSVAASRGSGFPASPGLLASMFILLVLACRLPGPFWFVGWLAPLVLLAVQPNGLVGGPL
jgi:hypothetical protein